jgi:hypothetical protein
MVWGGKLRRNERDEGPGKKAERQLRGLADE